MEPRLAFIVATKDRPDDLCRMLESLDTQTAPPDEIIVVDGSDNPVEAVVKSFPRLSLTYMKYYPPSASGQRNAGLNVVSSDMTHIGFLDDDIVIEKDACHNLRKLWQNAPPEVGGVSMNILNPPRFQASALKSTKLAKILGLYEARMGRVMPSGFQTVIRTVMQDLYVDWLPSSATSWRREVLERFRFDEWYAGYSYLEDLDFSYRAGKSWRLVILADAEYSHYPGLSGRGNGFIFGRREIIHRLYFVAKNPELSFSRCYMALFLRLMLSLSQAVKTGLVFDWQRIWGNVSGIIISLMRPSVWSRG